MTISPILFVILIMGSVSLAFGLSAFAALRVLDRADRHLTHAVEAVNGQVETMAKTASDQHDRMINEFESHALLCRQQYSAVTQALAIHREQYRQQLDDAHAKAWAFNWILLQQLGVKPEVAEATLPQPVRDSLDGRGVRSIGLARRPHRGPFTDKELAEIARRRKGVEPAGV